MSKGIPALGIVLVALRFQLGDDLAAQVPGTATLGGRVLDEAGDAVAGATLSLSNAAGSPATLTTETDAQGSYSFPSVSVGQGFTLTVQMTGYATVVAGPFELVADRQIHVDLTLKRSSDLEETVRVEAEGRIVDTGSATTASSFNAEFIEGLPLVGRRFEDVLTLAPGVTDTDGDGSPNVHGSRETGLQVRLDGTKIGNPLTGQFGQNINLESVEEVQIITAGAPAEYGGADGGFVNVITKSGGNDVSGSLKAFLRSDFLDGRPGPAGDGPEFTDSILVFTMGGPILRDRLWYFVSAQRLDEQIPVTFSTGETSLQSREGWMNFAKITWQADVDNKLAFQLNSGPLEFTGNNIGPTVAAESDFSLRTAGLLPQLTWTSVLSPSLLLQVVGSYLRLDSEIDPVSPDFAVVPVTLLPAGTNQFVMELPCTSRNCARDTSLHRFQANKRGALQEEGPYSFTNDVDLRRITIRSDLSLSLEEHAGDHSVKTGFEGTMDRYSETFLQNPVLTDRSCDFIQCTPTIPPTLPPPGTRLGLMEFEVHNPNEAEMQAESLTFGAYLQDAWRPRPNLTFNLGIRFDWEEVESQGLTDFDPLLEANEALRRFDALCTAADLEGLRCSQNRVPGRLGGLSGAGTLTPPPDHPALEFDANGDGRIDLSTEGRAYREPFTTPDDRLPEQYIIPNNNFSPRISVSWDPWNDGKTKLFGSYGRYYDRLFLGTVVTDQEPESFTAVWNLSASQQAEPRSRSLPLSNTFTIAQTDRELSTPYTIELTAGVERELAPEWSLSLLYIKRRGEDLLQDVDVNHILCTGFDEAFGVDPQDVCGDAGNLEIDRFGDFQVGPFGSSNLPNGAPDLYALNPFFNQVLRVGNANSSKYTAVELLLRKRLHRGWQMQMGYVYSEATGEAESFTSQAGNDPAVSDKVGGYLDYDQRHVLKWQAVTHLPKDIVLGGTVQWSSGLPYSIVDSLSDLDDNGSLTPQRVFAPTGSKNDQRNESVILFGGRIEKRFQVGATHIAGFLDVENAFDNTEVRFLQIDGDGNAIEDEALAGRRWQIGASILF